MKIELNITEEYNSWGHFTLSTCKPMLVLDGKNPTVVIIANDIAMYFHPGNKSIITVSDITYLKKTYTFVRYLEPSESVTFTG